MAMGLKTYSDYEKEVYNDKMLAWGKKHPLAAEIMFGKLKGKEKLDYIKSLVS
jgi:hypothetical protein